MANLKKTELDKLLKKPPEKNQELSDGKNLYLFVRTTGKLTFKYRIRDYNKATWVTIGDYPFVTLDEARKKSLELKGMQVQGINPNHAKQFERSKQLTVAELATQYITERMPSVRTKESSQKQFIRAINNDIVAIIGNMLVKEVNVNNIKDKLISPKIANGSPSVARRTLHNIRMLLDFAVEHNIIEYNPASKIRAVTIYRDKPRNRHLTFEEIKTFLKLVYEAQIKTQHKLAVHLSLILLTRKTELIHAKWDQIDFVNKTFTIKASKMGTQLRIPLSWQAIKIFEQLKPLSQDSEYIFIGRSGIKSPVSVTTLNWLIRPINQQMFGDNTTNYFTVHDLRRTGATILADKGYSFDWIEVALNHRKGGIKDTYNLSQIIKQREGMMQELADIIDSLIEPELKPYDKIFII